MLVNDVKDRSLNDAIGDRRDHDRAFPGFALALGRCDADRRGKFVRSLLQAPLDGLDIGWQVLIKLLGVEPGLPVA